MSAPERAILVSLVMLPGCLDLGESWDPTATSATTTASSSSTTTTTTGSTSTSTTGSTSASTTVATSTSGTETETEGCSFLGCRDTPTHDNIECDIWTQDCPDGEKCMPWANDGGSSWNATKCTPVDPNPDGVGEPCTTVGGGASGVDSCEEGAMCWGVNPETNIGYCVAFCEGEHNMPICDAGLLCAIPGAGIPVLCLPGCDPLDPHCFGDDLCVPGDNDVFWCAQDDSGLSGDYGSPCEEVNTCDPGLLCLPVADVPKCEAESCCSPYCDLGEPNTCPGLGQACIPYFDPKVAPEHYKHVGYCGIEG